jgi:PII-like signaling protein
MQPEQGRRLRLYVGETDKHSGMPLYEWVVRQAREGGLAGATVFRGVEGFGVHHKIHTAKILDIAPNLPVVVEIIDVAEKVDAFLQQIEGDISNGVVTTEDVLIRRYGAKS